MVSIIKYLKITIITLTLFITLSCGARPVGWGVLYIEDTENNVNAGTIMPVYQESEIRDVYTAEIEESGSRIEVERWKMSFYKKKADAEVFSKTYSEFTDIYAVVKKNGLSIRQDPNIHSERVYKLRLGQTVKIISRTDVSENIAGHDGYWYVVLTEDGSSGYCFDMNLNIYDRKATDTSTSNVLDDPDLQMFLTTPFRPEHFRDMVRDNMIDLSRFRTSYGIFAFPEENKVTLVTEDHNKVFDYTAISQNSSGRFIFEGTSLQVEVRTENRIAVYYAINKQEYAYQMVRLDNMEEIIESELERRDLLFEQLTELGTVSSTAYGRISFGENEDFTWDDNSRLVPNVIPESAQNNGSLQLTYLPGLTLRANYDGVLSFAFNGVPGRGRINFLFKLSDLGIKLVYVPSEDIEKNIVERESPSPLVIFMSGAGE